MGSLSCVDKKAQIIVLVFNKSWGIDDQMSNSSNAHKTTTHEAEQTQPQFEELASHRHKHSK